jgi:hypothetical protein
LGGLGGDREKKKPPVCRGRANTDMCAFALHEEQERAQVCVHWQLTVGGKTLSFNAVRRFGDLEWVGVIDGLSRLVDITGPKRALGSLSCECMCAFVRASEGSGGDGFLVLRVNLSCSP